MASNLRRLYGKKIEDIKFFVYVSGVGESCDYTRGCNTAMYALDAQTREEAEEEIYDFWIEETDGGFLHFFLIDASGLTVLDEKVCQDRSKREQAEEELQRQIDSVAEQEIRERAELERLKQKYC